MTTGNTSSAVMQQRHVDRSGLDLYPTPPWALRGFLQNPPAFVAVHAERVPMCADVWDPNLSSASCYAWFVWKAQGSNITELRHVPPDCRTKFSEIGDLKFAEKRSIDNGAGESNPLFDGVAE